ncbi:hypothetical protein ACFE04_004974 [Oxalis oulophora]
MLIIKKVPTLVSNYQDEIREKSQGCGRNCLGSCCLPVSNLPLYTFKEEYVDYSNKNCVTCSRDDEEQPESPCFLHNLLLGQWDERMNRGLFRYDVSTCETKVVPGKYGFIAQLNEGRHLKKRPTEFRVDRVLQPFDKSKFNFTKAGQEEVLFRFERCNDDESHFFPSAPVSAATNVVAINVSPIEYGHVLLIPRILDCLPQRIDHESFLLALHLAKEAGDPLFRIGYNSLGAFATINHLHFQAYYLAVPFAVEKVSSRRINTVKGLGVEVSELLDYPVRSLVFEGGNSMRHLSDAVASSCILLQDNNIPFNILIADCGRKVFLFPQCYAEKQARGKVPQEILENQINPAAWEISGHMVLKTKKDFEDATEENICRLLSEVSLTEEKFEEVITLALQATQGLQHEQLRDTEEDSINEYC